MSKTITDPSSSSDSIEVTGLWDFENAWVPKDYNLKNLTSRINDALRQSKSIRPYILRKKLIAIGPGIGDHAEEIKACSETIKLKPIPEANMRCVSCPRLVVRAIKVPSNQEQIMRNTDAADKYIIKKLFMKVLDKRTDFLVITGDVDFANSIAALRSTGINVLLAVKASSNERLCDSARVIWRWSSDKDGDPTMVEGCGPVPRHRLRDRAG